jgi:hypothetical protein
MSLELQERQEYVQMLAEHIEAENKATEELGQFLKRR